MSTHLNLASRTRTAPTEEQRAAFLARMGRPMSIVPSTVDPRPHLNRRAYGQPTYRLALANLFRTMAGATRPRTAPYAMTPRLHGDAPVASLGHVLQAGALAAYAGHGMSHTAARAKAKASGPRTVPTDDVAWCSACGAIRATRKATPVNVGANGGATSQTVRVPYATPDGHGALRAWGYWLDYRGDWTGGDPECDHGAIVGAKVPRLAPSSASPAVMATGRWATRSDAKRVHSPRTHGRIVVLSTTGATVLPILGATLTLPALMVTLADGRPMVTPEQHRENGRKGGRPRKAAQPATGEVKASKANGAKRAVAAVFGVAAL